MSDEIHQGQPRNGRLSVDPLDKNELDREKTYWRSLERERPADIETPGPGQESVWDFPRPPRIEPVTERLLVIHAGAVVAETTHGLRVVETATPPAYYFPKEDVRTQFLTRMAHTTLCEWKGTARYWTLNVRGRESEAAAWGYPSPDQGYEQLRDHVGFVPDRVDACYLDDERVLAQEGGYYGGWITSRVTGPFKGAPGTERW